MFWLTLSDARKQPRNLAAIIKGTIVLKLVVRKKVLKALEILALRTALKASAEISGVVRCLDGEHVFEMLEDPPEIRIELLKDYIDRDVGPTIKPRFAKVTALAVVPNNDDGAATLGAPTTQQPADATQQDETLRNLADEMQKLYPALEAAMAAHPGLKGKLLAMVSQFKQELKSPSAGASAAKETLFCWIGSA